MNKNIIENTNLDMVKRKLKDPKAYIPFDIYKLLKIDSPDLPIKLRELFKKHFTKERTREYLLTNLRYYMLEYLKIFTSISYEELKYAFLTDNYFEITEDDLKDMLEKLNFKKSGDEYRCHNLDLSTLDIPRKILSPSMIVEYMSYVNDVIFRLTGILELQGQAYDEIIDFIYNRLFLIPSDEEILEEQLKKYNIPKHKIEYILDIYDKEVFNIRYLGFNGNSWNEVNIYQYTKNTLLPHKPKKTNIMSYLELLPEEGLKKLLKYNEVDSINGLYNYIIDYLKKAEFYELELDNLLNLDDKELPSEFNSELFYNGVVFLYDDNGIPKLSISDEVKEVLNNISSYKENIELEDLVKRYVFINGFIKLDKLLELITNDNYINITKQSLIELIHDLGIYIINDDLITYFPNTEEELIEDLLKQKRLYKKYRVLDPEECNYEFIFYNELEDCLQDIEEPYNNEIMITIIGEVFMGNYTSATLKDILSDNNSLKYFDKISSLINEYYNLLGIWPLNGYTKLDNKSTSVKIGRNEPCPCGSGKKYKKCCGK